MELKQPRYLAPGCNGPTPLSCRWCAVTGLGSLPVPLISLWSAAVDDEPLKLRLSVRNAGNPDVNGKYVYVPRRRYWRNPECTLDHRKPSPSPAAPGNASASGAASSSAPGGWEVRCYDNKVQYRAPDCHDKSPCKCAGWVALKPTFLPLPTLCEVVAPSISSLSKEVFG